MALLARREVVDYLVPALDRAGLLWFLHGQRLVALAPKTAAIESTGARQTYYRQCVATADVVLAWELYG
jgi:hypothetical protein